MKVDEKLTQTEIDDLVRMLVGGSPQESDVGEERAKRVERYDFRKVQRLARDQLRMLARVNRRFTATLATFLTHRMRQQVHIDASIVQQITYPEFISLVPNPCLLAVLDVEDRGDKIVLQFNLDLVFVVYERLCGGAGTRPRFVRELSDLELAVVRRHFLTAVIDCLTSGWETVTALRFRLSQIESNPAFITPSYAQEQVVAITYEVRVGDVTETFSLCLPQSMVEHLLPASRRRNLVEPRGEPTERESSLLQSRLLGSRVRIEVPLGRTRIRVGELLSLQPGDVICFDQPLGEDLTIWVGGVPKFKGRPGRIGDNIAVQVTGRIEEERGHAR